MSSNVKCPAAGETQGKTYRYIVEFDGPITTVGRVEYESDAELVEQVNRVHRWCYEYGDEEGLGMAFCGWLLEHCQMSLIKDGKCEYIDIDNVAKRDLGECYTDEKNADGRRFFYSCISEGLCVRVTIELDEPFDPSKLVVGYRRYADAEGSINKIVWWDSLWYDGKMIFSDDNEVLHECGTTGHCGAWILEAGVRTRVCVGCERNEFMGG